MSVLLSVEDVRVRFGGVRALDGVSFDVESGSICGVIGPNGSGKTTMLGVISRLTPMAEGRLLFDGADYTRTEPHQPARMGIARTFQAIRLLPTVNVLKNVMVGGAASLAHQHPFLSLVNVPRSRRQERWVHEVAEAALERVGIGEHATAVPHDLPYGLQRRVEIARALAMNPKLLLLDEPMAGMNRSERSDISDLLLKLQSEGLTQILVEHDLSVIHRVCGFTVALDFGKVIARGTPAQVAADPAVREAYLGHEAAEEQDRTDTVKGADTE